MRDYNLTLSAGEQLPVYATGDYVRVRDASGPLEIETRAGHKLALLNGEAARIPAFDDLRVRNTHAQAQSVRLSIGNGAIESARGVVTLDSVPDVAWPAYRARVGVVGDTGNRPAVQFKNPAGSDMLCYIHRVRITGVGIAADERPQVFRVDPADELDGTGIVFGGWDLYAFDSATIASSPTKMIVLTAANSSWNSFNPPFAEAVDGYGDLFSEDYGPDLARELDFSRRPIVLHPTESLLGFLPVAESNFRMVYEWEERAA